MKLSIAAAPPEPAQRALFTAEQLAAPPRRPRGPVDPRNPDGIVWGEVDYYRNVSRDL